MNDVSYLNQPKKPAKKSNKKKKSSPSTTWNMLTGVMLLLTLGMCILFGNLFMNPFAAWNPLPPPTYTVTPVPPTATPRRNPPTWTHTPTTKPTATNTSRPTWTVEPSFTPFIIATRTPSIPSTKTPVPSKTAKPTGMPYAATISSMESTIFIPNSTCDTLYVAGQALDKTGTPVTALQVYLGGSLPGKSFTPALKTLAGLAPAYGPSGFEFNLGVKPVASKDSLWIQLVDQSGAPLTDQINLTTTTDCKKNLILVKFQLK
jgi:hypothetical protein